MIRELLGHPQYIAEFLFGRTWLLLGDSMPIEPALRLGEYAGREMMRYSRKSVKAAIENLQAAFPDMSADEAAALTRRVYEHFGRATMEVSRAHRLLGRSTFRQHVTVLHEEHLNEVRSGGKGAIFVAAHFGPWEVLSLLLHHSGMPVQSVYRPASNPLLNRFVLKRRAWFGQTTIPREGAMRHLLRTLRDGGYIALLADQYAKKYGVWVPFFGRLASTTPAPALLSLRTGAPIVTGYARRVPGMYKFEVFCDEPIRPEPTGDREADVLRITAEIARRTESYIRKSPEQWLWMHRRWRKSPGAVSPGGNRDVGSPGAVD